MGSALKKFHYISIEIVLFPLPNSIGRLSALHGDGKST